MTRGSQKTRRSPTPDAGTASAQAMGQEEGEWSMSEDAKMQR